MFRNLDKILVLAVMSGSFLIGRLSKADGGSHLDGLLEGIPEGYARALIELHLAGKITKEDLLEFMERV